MGDSRDQEHQHEGSYGECEATLAETWLLEVERRMRFLAIENSKRATASQRLRSLGILDEAPYHHAGSRCCAVCAFAHLKISFLVWRRGKRTPKIVGEAAIVEQAVSSQRPVPADQSTRRAGRRPRATRCGAPPREGGGDQRRPLIRWSPLDGVRQRLHHERL